MLSQKLAKASLAIVFTRDLQNRILRREELLATLNEWRQAHNSIVQRCSSWNPISTNPPAVNDAVKSIHAEFLPMAQAAEQLLKLTQAPEDLESNSFVQLQLSRILKHEPEFLRQMNGIVTLYEQDARRRVQSLRLLGWSIMLTVLSVLIVVQLTIIQPAVKLVKRELASSEAQYQRLVESMSDGLVSIRSDGEIQFANRQFCEMVGIPQDDFKLRSVFAMIEEPDPSQLEAMLQGTHDPFELKLRHSSNRQVDVIVSSQHLDGGNDNPHEILLIVTDITERKASELKQKVLAEQLMHAHRLRSMGLIAASLAHEIHQPLGTIANYAEGCLINLSTMEDAAQTLKAPIDGILKATLRAGEIIRRTRALSRQRPFSLKSECINSLIREICSLCQDEARIQGVHISLELEAQIPEIFVDGIQIQQILVNLVQNAFTALKSVESDHRRILISTHLRSDRFVELRVSDSGPGVAADERLRLFQSFASNRDQGTGLGLAISQSIVEAHGGVIWVNDSALGGAVFCFTLSMDLSVEVIKTISGSLEESAVDSNSEGER